MTFCELTMSEMDFWLFIQVRKKNGDLTPPPPPNTLYQLICGLQRQLRVSMDVQVSSCLRTPPSMVLLHTLMKRLKATGNYLNKKQAQPIKKDTTPIVHYV